VLRRLFSRGPRRLWVDLGDPGVFVSGGGPLEQWQDHGLGLLRTLLGSRGVASDVVSVRAATSVAAMARTLARFDVLLMNVRSYTFPIAREVATLFKRLNPDGVVVTGGLHASVAPAEMERCEVFDVICRGAGERIVADLALDPRAFPRVVEAPPPPPMADWPVIDRRLWPNPRRRGYPWPLEPACGWGPPPVATILTSRVCPWRCAFCNEASYIAASSRRPVDAVIDELNFLDRAHGPIGSMVVHDSMFFQQPSWLTEWLERYPRRARRRWPYWAAARADTVRRWPELFEALVTETNWQTISIGFESGSDRVLRILNKECTVADNEFTVDLLNRIGDAAVRRGQAPPRFWANIMLGVPGETRDDVFATMRMLRRMRYVIPSVSFFAPYPGSALGYQLIAEGRSLMTADNYHRYPHDEKVSGVDYPFLRDVLAGAYDDEIGRGSGEAVLREPLRRFASPHHFSRFAMRNGRSKLAFGPDPTAALGTLALRLPPEELALVEADRYERVAQHDLGRVISDLG